MKLMTALTVAGLLLATGFGGASAVSADDEAVDRRNRETTELIARLNGFDAATYAKTAAASGDHRLVVSDQTLQGSHTLGLACVAESRSQRSLLFGEHGLGNARLEKAFFQAAARFNRTMVATPRYPDRDICIPADTPIKSPDLSTRTAEQDLRPHVTGLSTAVRAQDVAATQRAISSGVNVDAPDEYGFTPLMWAIQRKNWSMAELLLAAGADPFASQGESVSSPLTIAVGTGELPLVENVLKSQVKGVASSTQPLGTPNYSDRPARLAVLLNRVDILERLIAFKAVPDARDTQGWRWTIQTAFKKNCTRCVEVILGYAGSHIGYSTDFQQIVSEEMESNNPEHLLILSRGASNSLAYSGATALALSAAADGNNAAVIRTILKSGQELNLLSETELQELITTIKAGRVGQLSHYMSLSAKRRKELNAAIAANNLSAISSSLPKTANLDQQNTLTPLMYAAMLSKGPTVEYLLKRGSHLEAQIGYLAISYADEAPAGYALTSPTPTEPEENHWGEIGRASCRERVCYPV